VRRKVALITGGITGIGKRTAIELARLDYELILTYRKSKDQAYFLAEHIQNEYNVRVKCIHSDVSDLNSCSFLVENLMRDFQGVDVLIHNAGPYIHERKKMSEYSIEEWQYIMNGNLNSFFYLTRLLLPFMRMQKFGRIITLGFDRSETAPAWLYRSAFAAAKSGLTSLTKTLALEEAENGITVNMVCPGDIVPEWKEKDIGEAIGARDESVPVGRPGSGEDISRVISFLCSEQSSFITGSVISVTGGKDILGKVHYSKKIKME